MQDRNLVQRLYQNQNNEIRKNIREIDMGYENFSPSNFFFSPVKRSDVNILVVGPPRSGRTCLLKTMQFALNGDIPCYIENRNLGSIYFDRYQIKQNRKFSVEGLTKIKQTDDKLGVYGYEINFSSMGVQARNSFDRYARTLQLMSSKTIGCGGNTASYKFGLYSINFIIVCLSMVQKLSKQQSTSLKFFINQLEQKRIRHTIVGTHLDQIFGRESVNFNNSRVSTISTEEQQRISYIQDWKRYIQTELSLRNNTEFYCMENYSSFNEKKIIESSEGINFYSLTLLHNCIKRAPESEKIKKAPKFLCF